MPKSKLRKKHKENLNKRNQKVADKKLQLNKAIEKWKEDNKITPLQQRLQERLAPILTATEATTNDIEVVDAEVVNNK